MQYSVYPQGQGCEFGTAVDCVLPHLLLCPLNSQRDRHRGTLLRIIAKHGNKAYVLFFEVNAP